MFGGKKRIPTTSSKRPDFVVFYWLSLADTNRCVHVRVQKQVSHMLKILLIHRNLKVGRIIDASAARIADANGVQILH